MLFMFHAKARIRDCGNFPRINQATSTNLYITTRKNALDTAEVLKTFEIQQYIDFIHYKIFETLSEEKYSLIKLDEGDVCLFIRYWNWIR